ncbi:uncharacterized protein L201_001779 [Kwoniella dendrophila CBS 6074]|uniref:Argonaute n=1 Tax=Kwoniella dendrophila CBS 6074 TaxID=1295534 RepID=A0AAX4JQT9_9TREE
MGDNRDVSDEANQVQNVFDSLTFKDARDDLASSVLRPDFGTRGRKIEVLANMFQADITNKSIVIYHYDISIESAAKQSKSARFLLASAPAGPIKQGLLAAAFDRQRNFFTPYRLALSRPIVTIPVELEDEATDRQRQARKFTCTIQLAREIDVSKIISYCRGQERDPNTRDIVATAKAAINTLLRQDLYDRFVPKGGQGRRFFTLDNAEPMSGAGLVLEGFIQSFLPTQSGLPAVQLDTAYGPFFRSGNLIQILSEIVNDNGGSGGRGQSGSRGGDRGGRGRGGYPNGSQRPLDDLIWKKLDSLKRLLFGAKYTLTYRQLTRPFRIEGITKQSAGQIQLKLGGLNEQPSKMVPVTDYFKMKYNITLKYPNLPMISTGKGNPPKLFPMELVVLENFNGIPFTSVSSDQTAEMIKVAAKRPQERQAKIMAWRKKIDYSRLPKLREWCLDISQEMMKVEARILEPPAIQYKGKMMRPANGAWNLVGNKFVHSNRPLKAWSIVCFDRFLQLDNLKSIVTQLVNSLTKNDCLVPNRQPPIIHGDLFELTKHLGRAADEASKYGGNVYPQLVVVIVPRREAGLYQAIKRGATNDLKKPVVTQILMSSKFRNERGLDQYLNNVTMKVHSKLGGVTHAVPGIIDKTTMMIGADVTHPIPASKDRPLLPSIAVSVASINADNNMFVPCVRLQKGRREMIEDLTDMMKEHIRRFEKKNGSKPQKIIFFGDGVSEGQFDLVATVELDRIRQAFRELDAKYSPTITLVICAKRHHMRFFATNPSDTDRTGNLPAGTCVDKDVTHPYAFDFYLQAHAGLQGTARPTHYVVIVDENKFSADRMQDLCNKLCYTYARASRSVSLIPVCYYADLIAWKARDFVYPVDDTSDVGSVITGSSGALEAKFDPNQLYERLEKVPQFNEVMWYM